MWVFTQNGFISLVQHPNDASQVIVRAMSKEAIESFLKKSIQNLTISYKPRNDYPFQASVPRPGVVDAMFHTIEAVNYPHFKASVKDNHYQSQCLNVWAEMQGLYEEETSELAELNALCASLDDQGQEKNSHTQH